VSEDEVIVSLDTTIYRRSQSATTRASVLARLSPRYQALRAKGERMLRDAYGIAEPTDCQIDALITKSWWLISDEVFEEFITESRGRPEIKLPIIRNMNT
jgi:hypothetical protein